MFGSFLEPTDAPAETYTPEPEPQGEPKNRMAFMILGALLGPLGAHNFYAGYKKKAITQLLITVLTLGFGSPMSWIWAIIDICTVNQDSKGVQFAS
jgi:TM2 domain-containing membrane protein YozV